MGKGRGFSDQRKEFSGQWERGFGYQREIGLTGQREREFNYQRGGCLMSKAKSLVTNGEGGEGLVTKGGGSLVTKGRSIVTNGGGDLVTKGTEGLVT